MKVAVTGATGFIGSALLPELERRGHEVVPISRSQRSGGSIQWEPSAGRLDCDQLSGIDAVVHLAGESIAGRWTREKKRRIRESRVLGAQLLAGCVRRLQPAPRVFISASAVGYYGDRGDELLDESRGPGDDFLAQVCLEWEQAAQQAASDGTRVIQLRFGIVFGPGGGSLPLMAMPFRFGLGGTLGDGEQWFTWVSLTDVVAVIARALEDEQLSGAINVVAPEPVTNRQLTAALGDVLGRPTFMRVPRPVLKLALGEAGDAVLASVRVQPARLQELGYTHREPDLHNVLRRSLRR